MNKSYKLVFNKKRGEFVVTSELAQGAKKSSAKKLLPLAAALLLLPFGISSVSQADSQDIKLNDSYHATQLKWEEQDGKRVATGIDNDKLQTKTNESELEKLKANQRHNIKYNHVKIMNGKFDGPKEDNPIYENLVDPYAKKTYTFAELVRMGVASLSDGKGGNITYDNIKDITLDNAHWDGEKFVYAEASLTLPGREYVDQQPHMPYYEFNLATSASGTMVFAEGAKWRFGQAKKSDLFVAKDGAHIEVGSGANIEVDFGDQRVYEKQEGKTDSIGINYTWSGKKFSDLQSDAKLKDILGLDFEALNTAIDTEGYGEEKQAELKDAVDKMKGLIGGLKGKSITSADLANEVLEVLNLQREAFKDTSLGSINEANYEDYLAKIKELVISKSQSNYEYVIKERDNPFFDKHEAFTVKGKNSIFKSGEGSKVEFKTDSKVKVIGGDILSAIKSDVTVEGGSELVAERGNAISVDGGTLTINKGAKINASGTDFNGNQVSNVNATKGAEVNNYAQTEVGSGGQNALIESGSKYNQHADLYFNVKPDWTVYKDANGDIVKGAGSTYTIKETGNIYSTGLTSTITAESGGAIVNNGAIYIAVKKPKNNVVSNGILLKANGNSGEKSTFTNSKDKDIFVGYDAGNSMAKVEGLFGTKEKNIETRYKRSAVNSAISVEESKNSGSYSIDQAGNITLQNYGAGINAEAYTFEHSEITHSGEITIDGDHSVGIRVGNNNGADYNMPNVQKAPGAADLANNNVKISGEITAKGKGNTGVHLTNGVLAVLEGNASISIEGAEGADVLSYGAYVNASRLTIADKATIKIKGENVVGARAVDGGVIVLSSEDAAGFGDLTKGNNLTQYWISGVSGKGDNKKSSKIMFTAGGNVDLKLAEDLTNSTLFRVDNGASLGKSDGSDTKYKFTIESEGGVGLDIANKSTEVILDDNFTFNVNAKDAVGIRVTSQAGADDTVVLGADTNLSVAGDGATVVLVDGRVYENGQVVTGKDGNTTEAKDTRLISHAVLCSEGTDLCEKTTGTVGTVGEGAYGYKVLNKGTLEHHGKIDLTSAKGATAIYLDGGVLDNQADTAILVGVEGVDDKGEGDTGSIGVDVHGADSIITNLGAITALNGKAAVNLNAGASLTVKGEGASLTVKGEGANEGLITGAGSADGIRINSGATLGLEKAQIEVSGTGAGLNFQNAGDHDEKFYLSSTGIGTSTIKVSGAGTGVLVNGEDGSTINNNFYSTASSGLVIEVGDEADPTKTNGGKGIVTNTRGLVYSGISVKMYGEKAEAALRVMGGTKDIRQFGILESWATAGNVVDLRSQSIVIEKVGGIPDIEVEDKTYKFKNLGEIKAHNNGSNAIIANSNYKNKEDGSDKITITNGNSDGTKAIIEGKILLGGTANYIVQLYGGSSSTVTEAGAGKDIFELIDVKKDDSSDLFEELDGGAGDNKLVLKATNPKNNVELSPSSHYVFNKNNTQLKNIANLEVKQDARFELDNSELVDVENSNKHLNIDIDSGGQLDINQKALIAGSSYSFENKLTGEGLVTTNLGNTANKFNFTDSNKADGFKGTFAIGNGTFEVVGKNANALANATLRLDGSGVGVMNEDSIAQKIGGLKFNTGTFVVEELIYGQTSLESMLEVGKLDLTGKGTIKIELGDHYNQVFGTPLAPEGNLEVSSLLMHDRASGEKGINDTVQIIKAKPGEVEGSGANIELVIKGLKDIDLASPEFTKQIDIVQSGSDEPVAIGKYGLIVQTTKGNSGTEDSDGLYLGYALDEVGLIGKVEYDKDGKANYIGALNLKIAGAEGHQKDLQAKVTDTETEKGDLVINTGEGNILTLSNSSNDYSGETHVVSGHLGLVSSNVLGKTSLLQINDESAVIFGADVGGNSFESEREISQEIGQLKAEKGAILFLNSGKLTIVNNMKDSYLKGNNALHGNANAEIVVQDNDLLISGNNSNYHGNVTVASSATLELNHAGGVGHRYTDTDGKIELAGKLHLNGVSNKEGEKYAVFSKTIEGTDDSNEVLINNNSTVVFVADHTGIRKINIGGASDTDASRMIVQKEAHLAGTDKTATDIAKVNIRKNSTLEFNTNEDHWVVKNAISGAGNLHKLGAGIIELNEASAKYTGKTTVESGILIAGNDKTALDLASTEMLIEKSGTFAGFGSIDGAVTNKGNFFVGKLVETPEDPHGTIESKYAEKPIAEVDEKDVDSAPMIENAPTVNNKNNIYTVKGNFENSGNIFLSNSFADERLGTGTNLKVEGNYFANGGAIFMNTTLNAGHEAESTDKLIVGGNVVKTGDATKLYISNAQGNGAYTDEQPDAIEVVHVEGVSDKNAFTLGNRVAIGVYEYTLHQGRNPENSQSWFLDSYDKNLNPGIGAFIGNQNAAIGMFSMTLHDRMGNLGYSDPSLITEDDDTLNSAWVRIVAERSKYKAIDQKMSIKSNTYIVHLGTDFYKWTDDMGATRRLGVMAGYGHGDIKSRSNTGFNAQGKIDSAYNLGLYGTYYNPNGFYVDAWAQHSWFKNEISIGGASKNYRSKLLSLSLEVGHTFDISEVSSEGKQWRFQPQGQVTWHKYKLRNNVVSDSGLAVTNLPSHTTVARLGAKFIYANAQDVDNKMQPFVELNWIHSNANKAIEFNDWYTTSNNAPKNRYELKVGIEGKYNNRWSVWGNVATQMGKDSYRNYRGTVGAKYDF